MSAPYVTIDQEWVALFRAGKVRWMPGMVYSGGDRVLAVDDTHALWFKGQDEPYWEPLDAWVIPDFTDPATIGCLLHQAREVFRDATTQIDGATWWLSARNGAHLASADNEPSAILAAIAAAPPKVIP
jgi:hypothetical protein